MCYSDGFIKITNKVLENPGYNYFDDFHALLVKHKDISINEENYLKVMKTMTFDSIKATQILMFLETCINTDSHTVALDLTVEHIYSQKNKENLLNKSLLHNIGNLTLVEKKNSSNGHKGNCSMGSKPYNEKITSYQGSSSMITRTVASTFASFTEETIVTRNKEIIKLLNKHTNY